MTAIVGLAHGGKVYMGGDSAATDHYYGQVILAHPKVFKLKTEEEIKDNQIRQDELLIGGCGSIRAYQLLQHKVKLPALTDDDRADLYKYVATTFVDRVRAAMKDNGYHYQYNGLDFYMGEFLVGVEGELFRMVSDYGVIASYLSYQAIGCGQDYALGSFEATYGFPPEERIVKALGAAGLHNAGVAPPYYVEVLGAEKVENKGGVDNE